MKTKPFSQELYNQNDNAKELAIKWFDSIGFKLIVNKDQYGIDLVGNKFMVEVEVKHNWKGKDFPFETVHIPGRKLKFANDKSIFFMFNHDKSYAMLIDGKLVSNSSVIIKDNIYLNKENFIEVNIKNCTIVRIQ